MAKNFRRMLAMVLVMCMFVSALPMQALAAEEGTSEPTITVDEEIITNTDTTSGSGVETSFTPTSNENVTNVTVSGTNENGATVSMSGTVETSTSSTSSSKSASADVFLSGTETKGEGSDQVIKEVTHEEKTTNTITTNSDGSTSSQTVNDGTEIKEWVGEGVENIEGAKDLEDMEDVKLPSVEVELIPGKESEPVKVTGKVEGQIGDVTEGENDTEYDYTDVTIEVNRTVSAEASEITVDVQKGETKYESTLKPVESDDKHYNTHTPTAQDPQHDGLNPGMPHDLIPPEIVYKTYQEGDEIPEGSKVGDPIPDGKGGYLIDTDKYEYEVFLSGQGESTDAAIPVFKNIVYKRYKEGDELPEGYTSSDLVPDGNGMYLLSNSDGSYVIDEEKSHLINPGGYVGNSGMKYAPAQLELKYGDDFFYAYCADYLVEASQDYGNWYELENLEDSGHFKDEDAAKLRAIVENAYWGTTEGKGSLSNIQDLLRGYYSDPDAQIIVQDKNGKEEPFSIKELIDGLKEHEALAVSQAAIWAYSINRTNTAYKDGKLPAGVDDVVVTGVQSAIKAFRYDDTKEGDIGSWVLQYIAAKDQFNSDYTLWNYVTVSEDEKKEREKEALASDARMKALFDYFMQLAPKYNTAEGVTTVINEKNSIENISLVVHDRADHENNLDDNYKNDVYNISLNFQLAFTPGDNDDVYVELTNGDAENPQPVEDADGNPIIKRLKLVKNGYDGADKNDENVLAANSDGVYTLSGLKISENTDFTFGLRLDCTQELEEGVYLYTAEGGRMASQTLVGIAKGERKVTVNAKTTVKFDVDEKNHVRTERHWHKESDPVTTHPPVPENPTPKTTRNVGGDPAPAPQIFRLNNQNEELVEIPEEPVPLATPVVTGDHSGLWVAVILFALCGIVAVNVFDKKRQHESF